MVDHWEESTISNFKKAVHQVRIHNPHWRNLNSKFVVISDNGDIQYRSNRGDL